MVGQGVTAKVLAVVGQIVLARFLGPRKWGLVGLAYTVFGFANLIQQSGVREVLIHRQARFYRWANAGFWMSLTGGLLAGAIMAAAAPLAAHFYSQGPQFVWLILILAVSAPLSSLAIVPTALLQNQLRFRPLTVVTLMTTIGTFGLAIIFAWRGWGAFSYILPVPIVALANAAWLWAIARPPIRLRPQLRRWRYLIGDSGRTLGAAFFFNVTVQGGVVVLGLFHADDATIGIYTFALVLSLQTTQLLTANFGSVLFPALSQLQGDPPRQQQAFLRAVRCLTLIGVPLCLLQAACSESLLRLLYGTKWMGAVHVLQVLSIAMAVQLANPAAISLLQAQGRFRTVLNLSMGCALLFLVFTVAGAVLGGA